MIQQLCQLYGVEKTRTTPYHPQGNGQCERFNRTLPSEQKSNWPTYLQQLTFAYNTTVHQSTSEQPYFLMFGLEPQLPIDFLLGRVEEPVHCPVHSWVQAHQKRLNVAHEGARKRMRMASQKRVEVRPQLEQASEQPGNVVNSQPRVDLPPGSVMAQAIPPSPLCPLSVNLRRTTRSTAGHHSNIHRLPQPGAARSPSINSVLALHRSWL